MASNEGIIVPKTNENFMCKICHKGFDKKTELTLHASSHCQKNAHACNLCSKSFSRKNYLNIHIKSHSKNKPQLKLNRPKQSRSEVKLEIRNTSSDYVCSVCQKSFGKKRYLIEHSLLHTGEKPHRCDVCNKSFRVRKNLRMHYRIHTGERPYACPVCGKAFRLNGDMKSHVKTHKVEKPYKCEVCENAFISLGDRRSHGCIQKKIKPKMLKTHLSEKLNKTKAMSKKSLENKSLLKGRHPKLTKEVKLNVNKTSSSINHVCSVCQKSFRTEFILTTHFNRCHTGEKKSLGTRKVLQTPTVEKKSLGTRKVLQTPTVEKTLVCTVCSKTFKNERQLRGHNIMHGKGKSKTKIDGTSSEVKHASCDKEVKITIKDETKNVCPQEDGIKMEDTNMTTKHDEERAIIKEKTTHVCSKEEDIEMEDRSLGTKDIFDEEEDKVNIEDEIQHVHPEEEVVEVRDKNIDVEHVCSAEELKVDTKDTIPETFHIHHEEEVEIHIEAVSEIKQASYDGEVEKNIYTVSVCHEEEVKNNESESFGTKNVSPVQEVMETEQNPNNKHTCPEKQLRIDPMATKSETERACEVESEIIITDPNICADEAVKLSIEDTSSQKEDFCVEEDKTEDVNLQKKNICSVCQRGFIFENNLKRHMHVHTEEEPFKCEECGSL